MANTLFKLGAAAALALSTALPVQAQNLDTVVATVNDTDITLGHMLVVRSTLPEQYQQLPDNVLWDGILDQIVQQQVLADDDKARETARVKLAVENEHRALLAAEAIKSIADTAVTEDAVRATYDAQFAGDGLGKEFNASHILVETEAEAEDLVAQLDDGADFADLAKANSTGPSGPNGGELGWFGAGMMVEPFQNAVDQMAVGDVTGPVQTQFGWHVIKLNDTRDKEAPALDEVRAQIETTLQQDAVKAYIEDALGKATVTRMDPAEAPLESLSNMQLLEE
ncbi:peptidylprolyl isomerase [Salipiger aestuarii]|uniref:Parvulin-like PPIase n=1 Tax=Salipiger aestuarii TaxID=568098 RepID=A0A327YCZ7_9RHOB|nr:peptidylprolyl isomerase [Salipiger aestuarii]EIE51850.1 PpiC-type peptidyl-prolyl cis-trans isomerase [Citreicella sp. 357]KAA8608600.1 peptidylprolyl isomerase [Salipiger aestuarii]KAA8614151.1 peptidylprolyl isomerase [Salipiger aestuarii]KAB2542327.1 peptidylprolyl isomerase [Salipiger aestuarii]RAK18361.1 peptidyl-prolyl cis-trans isomerase C [Salipiger aestuarii]